MILFVVLSSIHVAIFLWLHYHWIGIPKIRKSTRSGQGFTVLIPVRNEEQNIVNLLWDLNDQTHPRSQFEVIVVDDSSDDKTADLVQGLIDKVEYELKYYLSKEKSGKKAAITEGVNQGKFDFILATDGDCRVSSQWIESFAQGYTEEVIMQAGPVLMYGKGFIESIQKIEFSSLIGFGAAAIQSGNPSTCNGANMSYRKTAFLEVNGYSGNDQIPSGDDEFLLQKLHLKYPRGIRFLKDENAIVSTPAKQTLRELINQRVRWSSKWRFHKNRVVKLAVVYIFLDFFYYIVSIFLALFGVMPLIAFGLIVGFRMLVSLMFLFSVGNFFAFKKCQVLSMGLALHIIYPVFVSFLGLASIFGRYSWKGRKY